MSLEQPAPPGAGVGLNGAPVLADDCGVTPALRMCLVGGAHAAVRERGPRRSLHRSAASSQPVLAPESHWGPLAHAEAGLPRRCSLAEVDGGSGDLGSSLSSQRCFLLGCPQGLLGSESWHPLIWQDINSHTVSFS